MRYSIKDFRIDFPNDDACLDYIFNLRYKDIASSYYRVKGRKCYENASGNQIHPLRDTIFEKSSTPLTLWFHAIYLFSASKNGVSAKELERQLGVTYKTAWRIAKQIRSLMTDGGTIGSSGSIVEADETYMGGVRKGAHGSRGKTPILGIIEREGEARVVVSDTASTSRIKTFFAENLVMESELHTDESVIYLWTDKLMEHHSINHSKGEYSRNGITTNTIEGFWGQLKRSIDGTYHSVSRKYLQMYVNEFSYRYNCRASAVPIFQDLVQKI